MGMSKGKGLRGKRRCEEEKGCEEVNGEVGKGRGVRDGVSVLVRGGEVDGEVGEGREVRREVLVLCEWGGRGVKLIL